MRIRCDWCQRVGSYDPEDILEKRLRELKSAIEAHGALPHGFCVCPQRDTDKADADHVGECRELRLVLRRVDEIL